MSAKWVHRYERKPGRWVFDPSPEARLEGLAVKELVELHWRPPSNYFHLKAGGHVAALRKHVGSAYFLKLDISDFFGSITRSRVSRVLKGYVGHKEARRLATLSTVRHPGDARRVMLPYGFVQSPLLASVVLHKSGLGGLLDRLHAEPGLVVTVYVDDLIVSGNNLERLNEVLAELKMQAAKSGFDLSGDKEQGPAAAISAFNIELVAGNELAVRAERMSELARIFATSTSAYQKAGIVGYVRTVSCNQADALLA